MSGVQYSPQDPGAGDVSGLMAMATSLRQRSEHLQSMAGQLSRQNSQVDETVWKGLSAAVWRLSGPVVVTACQNTAQVLHDGAMAIAQYVMLVETIQSNQRVPAEQIAEATKAMQLCTTTDWYTGNRFVTDPALIPQVQSLVHQEALESRRMAQAQLMQMFQDRKAADNQLIGVLTSAPFVDQVHVAHQILSATGSVAPGELDAVAVTQLADLLGRIDSVGDYPTDVTDQLHALLDLFGRDEAMMDAVIGVVGAAGVVAAIRGIAGAHRADGRYDMTANLRSMTTLRDHFARYARGLDRGLPADMALVDRWAEEIVSGGFGPDSSGWAEAVGFLFADPAESATGMRLTLAVADLIDARERETGQPWYDASATSAVRSVVADAYGSEAAERLRDPGARTLQMLGAYPDAALAWVSDSSDDPYRVGEDGEPVPTGQARLEHWFGRDASLTGDGLEGVFALLVGAWQATGGPTDASTFDEETWQQAATAFTRAARALQENDTAVPENASAGGAEQVMRLLSLAMPQLADSPVYGYREARATDENRLWRSALIPGMGYDEVPAVNLTKQAMADLVAIATATQASARGLAENGRTYQNYLTTLTDLGICDAQEMIDRNLALQWTADGGELGGEAGAAGRKDERAEALIDAVSTVVGNLPSKGLGEVAEGALGYGIDLVQNLTIDQVVSAGEEHARLTWTQNLAQAEERMATDLDMRRSSAIDNAELLAREYGIFNQWDHLEADQRQAQIDQWRDVRESRYIDGRYAAYGRAADGRTPQE